MLPPLPGKHFPLPFLQLAPTHSQVRPPASGKPALTLAKASSHHVPVTHGAPAGIVHALDLIIICLIP